MTKHQHHANKVEHLRKFLGLSKAQVASYTQTRIIDVHIAENGTTETPATKRITSYLERTARKILEEEEKKKAFYKHFDIGKKYYISSKTYKEAGVTTKSGTSKSDNPSTNLNLDSDWIFEFIGDEGKHHCFKEIHGGWKRTYTDAQLVDKRIQEVGK